MTVHVARRRTPRVRPANDEPAPPSTLAIGEIDQTVFSCPVCERPLALGAGRCSGCQTRLVRGVQLGKAASFVAVGLLVGALSGGGVAAALTASRIEPVSPAVPVPSAVPVASAAPLPAATTAPIVGIPAASRAALVQAMRLDLTLAEGIGDLEAALAARDFNAMEVAKVLRQLSATAVIGLQLAPRIEAWDAGEVAGADLTTVYASIHAAAGEGLDASVRNEEAYESAARNVVALLPDLWAADDAARTLATDHRVDVPVTIP